MKKIVFKWSGSIYSGFIVNQEKSEILGLKTEVKVLTMNNQPLKAKMTFTFYGKCEVGYCGNYNVISITTPLNPLKSSIGIKQ